MFREISEQHSPEISHALSTVCSVEILQSTSTAIVAMHEQTSEYCLGRNTVANSPVTIQNFTSHSQETVNFNDGAFSGANVTINIYNSNDFVFVIEVIKTYFLFCFETFVIKFRLHSAGLTIANKEVVPSFIVCFCDMIV